MESSSYALPAYQWAAEGWILNMKAWPLNAESRGKSPSLIGSGTFPVSEGNIRKSISKNIKKKAAKYGDLDAPLAIAVNAIYGGLLEVDEEEALLGTKAFVVSPDSGSVTVKRVGSDGVWLGNTGPKGLRCSAAWIFRNLRVSSLGESPSTVYFNPWANNPGPTFLQGFDHAKIINFEFVRAKNVELREMLRLGKAWSRDPPYALDQHQTY
jgi:hypothetical protein